MGKLIEVITAEVRGIHRLNRLRVVNHFEAGHWHSHVCLQNPLFSCFSWKDPSYQEKGSYFKEARGFSSFEQLAEVVSKHLHKVFTGRVSDDPLKNDATGWLSYVIRNGTGFDTDHSFPKGYRWTYGFRAVKSLGSNGFRDGDIDTGKSTKKVSRRSVDGLRELYREREECIRPVPEVVSEVVPDTTSAKGLCENRPIDFPEVVSDELWSRIAPLLPAKGTTAKGGRPGMNNRRVVLAVFHYLREGIAWRNLPAYLGKWRTVADRFHEWQASGAWAKVEQAVWAN